MNQHSIRELFAPLEAWRVNAIGGRVERTTLGRGTIIRDIKTFVENHRRIYEIRASQDEGTTWHWFVSDSSPRTAYRSTPERVKMLRANRPPVSRHHRPPMTPEELERMREDDRIENERTWDWAGR